MNKHLVYIDQNVVGLQLGKHLKLTSHPEYCWVYSKEHFAEIRRSSNAKQFLSSLESIDAKLLDLELNSDGKITGNARLIEDGTPLQHYEAYLEATNEVDFNENLFDPFLIWVNGGGEEDLLKDFPEQLTRQVLELTKDLPDEATALNLILENTKPEFSNVIDQLIEQGNNVSMTRKAMGDGNGLIGGIKGKNVIKQIWEIVGPTFPDVTCDQFFGFDPIDKGDYESWPYYLGIVGCCAVMDIIGYQSEKKCRKIEKLPNVRSDAGHIAMGAFCSAILSGDKRLINRAKAIYEYKNLNKAALLIEIQANNSTQSNTDAPTG